MQLKSKNDLRKRRHARVRSRIIGTQERPRLTIFKSNRFISAQLINDDAGHTLAAAHGSEFKGSQQQQAILVGSELAKRGKAAGVTSVVFDRGGYQYAAQIKALAEAARAEGLTF